MVFVKQQHSGDNPAPAGRKVPLRFCGKGFREGCNISHLPRTAIVGGNQASVDLNYYRADTDDPLNVSQIRGGDNSTTFGVGPQATVVEVEVNGGPATFIGNAFVDYSDSQNPDRERLANMLLWEEGDYTFKIMSFELSQSELLAIAHSMYD